MKMYLLAKLVSLLIVVCGVYAFMVGNKETRKRAGLCTVIFTILLFM